MRLSPRLNAHPGSKTNASSLNGGSMRAFSVIRAKPCVGGRVAGPSGRRGLGEIICIMRSQSVHLQVGSLERKTAPLLMPCVFTEEVGHSTMEPAAAVGTLPLHNTLSVMCSDYSEPQPLQHPPPESCYFILQMHMDMTFNIVTEWRMTGFLLCVKYDTMPS